MTRRQKGPRDSSAQLATYLAGCGLSSTIGAPCWDWCALVFGTLAPCWDWCALIFGGLWWQFLSVDSRLNVEFELVVSEYTVESGSVHGRPS